MHRNIFFFALILCTKLISQDIDFFEVKLFDGYPDYLSEAKYSPLSSYYVIATGENKVELYNDKFQLIWEHAGIPESRGSYISFSPDEKFMTISRFRTNSDIGIIKLPEFKLVQVINEHTHYVGNPIFSNSGRYFVTTSSDETMQVFEMTNGNPNLVKTIIDNEEIEINKTYKTETGCYHYTDFVLIHPSGGGKYKLNLNQNPFAYPESSNTGNTCRTLKAYTNDKPEKEKVNDNMGTK